MASIEVRVPDLGTFKDVAVIELLVKPGDQIEVDASIATLETEKATMDVPSTVSGKVVSLHIARGGTVTGGDLVAIVEGELPTKAEAPTVAAAPPAAAAPARVAAPAAAAPTAVTAAPATPATPVLTAVEPKTEVPTLELCAVGNALEDDFQVVKSKVKALALTVEPNPAGIRTVVARNLPRDIKDTEIRTLFGAHAIAGLRDVYIPRNTDKSSPHFGTLKGFALVKFHTVAESTRAFEALKTLTIRGKNIALEFAKEDR